MTEDFKNKGQPIFISDDSILLNLDDTAFVSRRRENTSSVSAPVNHTHLDSFIYWLIGEFPDAGINLVECADGTWFIAADHGTRFNEMSTVFVKDNEKASDLTLFTSEESALSSAFSCIKKAFPQLESKDLTLLYEEYSS